MSEELLHVTQADREAAAQWGFIECRHCSEYEGNFVDDLAADFAKHRLSALIDHLEADGMVLVPREPTEAMIEAAVEAEDEICCEEPEPYIRASWTAMLSALPVLGVGR